MELTKEQKEKLKDKTINFIDELIKIIDIYGINKKIKIYCKDYFNTYGGLKVIFTESKYIYYETNRTILLGIYTGNSNENCIYKKLKNNELYFNLDILMDLLANEKTILDTLENILKQDKQIIDDLLK